VPDQPEVVGLPVGYTSGAPINSGMVFSDATIAGLTMIPGTYNYALPYDTITLVIEGQAPAIPEPSTIAIWSLLGLAGLGYGWRKKRKAA
jgi:hypothetical protein